jgi:hypothetical protein
MIRVFTVFLFIIPFLNAQDKSSTLSYPAAVIWNTPFEISLIASAKFPGADKLEIIISTDNKLELISAYLNTFYGNNEIDVSKEFTDYKIAIDLRNNSVSGDMNYQVVFNFKPGSTDKAVIKFSGKYFEEEKLIGELFEGYENSLIAGIEFYKPKKYAGKALQIKDAYIDFQLNKLQYNNLAVDFWFKTAEKDFSLLKISERNEEVSEVFINSFGMLSLQSNHQNKILNPYFISYNTWNHILLYSDYEKGIFDFYCNGYLVSSSIIDALARPENIKLSFSSSGSKEFYIDQLKFSSADETGTARILEGMDYTSPPDGIRLIRIFRFDNENLARMTGDLSLDFNNIKFVRSDAPLSLRAPELNINLLSSSFELEWNEGDFRYAQQYILERSENNLDFVPVYSVGALNHPEAEYRYVDKILRSSDIIYYRVKQVLKDGSAVYSSQVKVGQGFSEPFVLGQNFPNPFNPRTSIDLELFRDSELHVIIYSLEGKEILKLFDGYLIKGKHKFSFDGSEFPSGVYICRVYTPEFSQTTKMILTK